MALRAVIWFAVTLASCIVGVACAPDRPSFYDQDNFAQYYGRCPRCKRWEKGYYTICDSFDEHAKLRDTSHAYRSYCENCGVYLVADEPLHPDGDERIVKWRID